MKAQVSLNLTQGKGNHMTKGEKKRELMARLYRQTGVFLSFQDAETLRKAELTLHRWSERKCGWSTSGKYGASMALVRDEDGDGKPYLEIHPNVGMRTQWVRTPDLEKGALRRVAEVCKRNGLEYFHQGDPRGCSLFISKAGAGMNDANYSGFVACHVS